MHTSRRDFLKGATALSTLSLLLPSFRALANPLSDDIPDAVTAFLTAMERPYAAPVNLPFERIIGNKTIGLLLYDVNNARLVTALNPEKLFPVASAFKAPLLMYFLDQIDPDVWNLVPVEAWSAATTADVPEDAHDAWRQHNGILRALWQMIVFSDNPATGTVLAYVAESNERTDAIVAFNDWLAETVGVSQLSGVSAWGQGVVGNFTVTDERFKDSGTTINGQVVTLENLMTPRDLGLPYMWMLSEMSEDGRRVCMELLSVIHNGRGANLERLATENDGTPHSKNGSLQTDAGYVVADAGLIDLPDDRRYLLVFLSLNAPETVQTVFEELNLTLRGKHNELLHNRHVVGVTDEELTASYREHLAAAYPLGEDATPGLYRYGFVIPAGVTVYRTPDEDNALHNPIIKSTRFGIHLLMQGALVRYVEVDDEWVELMPDNDFDNVRSRLGIQVFLKREDVWPISLDYAVPIPYLVEPDIVHEDKFVVIHLAERELFAFEGETPVMRVPIVLNPDATPRGAQVITSKWFARSMQPWAPGVPFTSFFGSQGFALHGSPWQRWSTTVNKETIYGRSSAGCVNVPDWSVMCGGYTRPADELLFRWIGGIENPQEAVFEYPSETYPALRIYTGDYLHNLRNLSRPLAMVNRGLSWDDVIERMESIPLQAPDSFFV